MNIFLLIQAYKDIKKDVKVLESKFYKDLFGVFYEDFGKKTFEGLIYQLLYFMRRDLYIFIGFYFYS